jgi:hypothetical protein
MILSQEIEGIENDEMDKEKYNLIMLKYDNLIQDCAFEEIPTRFKQQVAKIYTDADRYIPIQLNGTIGNIVKRNSKDIVKPFGACSSELSISGVPNNNIV